MKLQALKRAAVLALAATMLLGGSAQALFGKKQAPAVAEEGAPTAQDVEVRTYRGIPVQGQFLASDAEGEDMTFAVVEEPRKGTVTIQGADFTYTPDEGVTGGDSFTYADTEGKIGRAHV